MGYEDNTWISMTLGDLVTLSYGKSLPERKRSPGKIPVYGSNGVTGYHDQALVSGPGIIVGRKGTSGAVHYCKTDYFPIDTTFYITHSEDYDLRFVYYLLQTLGLDKLNFDSAVPGLNRNTAYSIPIKIPQKEEQQKIASILSALNDKIELNHQMNRTLEEMAQAIFKSWFVDFEPFQNEEFEYNDELQKEIPKGWEVASLFESHQKNRDCVITGPFGSNLHAFDYRETGNPLILVKHVDGGRIIEEDLPRVGDHKFPELERYRLQEGDIAFTRVGAVGRTAYIHPRYVGWLISGQMLRVRVDRAKINPRYLSELYITQSFQEKIENYAVGSTRPSLNTKIVGNLKILVPPIDIQNNYANMVAFFDDQIQSNIAESLNLQRIRDALLPKLLSGEIRVTVNEKAEAVT